MKKYLNKIYMTYAFLIMLTFAVYEGVNLPLTVDYVLLIYVIALMIFAFVKKAKALLFYSIALGIMPYILIAELLSAQTIIMYVSIMIFYLLSAGFIFEVLFSDEK